MSDLTVYLSDKVTKAPLAEIRVSSDTTVGSLRAHIRDCPEMAAFPQRLFSHWWVKTRRSVLLAEIPSLESEIDQLRLSEVGLEDEGTVLLELRGIMLGEERDDSVMKEDVKGYASAVAAADKRSESRFDQLVTLFRQSEERSREQLNALRAANESLRDQLTAETMAARVGHEAAIEGLQLQLLTLTTQNETLGNRLTTLEADEAARHNELKDLQRNPGHAAETQRLLRSSAKMAEATHALALRLQHPSYPHRVAETPCGISALHITYPDLGKQTRIESWEPGNKSRPLHFPNARIPAGTRCLVEFSFAASSPASPSALRFGFAPFRSEGHMMDTHDYGRDTDCFNLNLLGTSCVCKGSEPLAMIPNITQANNLRVALLMDRSRKGANVLRVFVNSKVYGPPAVPILPAEEVEYVPVASPQGPCVITVTGIYFGSQMPAYAC